MGTLRQVASAILILSAIVFVALFGHIPAFRNTPLGWAHRLIWVWIPRWFTAIDNKLTGGRIVGSVIGVVNYLMYERHPTVKAFYLILVTGGLYLFYSDVWQHLWSPVHKFFVPIVSVLPYISMHIASTGDPGYITQENHARAMQLYPFDHANFLPRNCCSTCLFEKPARSKHCSICKHCIAKSDHHCIWINNCIGHNNMKHFLFFLMSTNVLLIYGFFLTYIIMAEVIKLNLPKGLHISDLNWSQYFTFWVFALTVETYSGILCLLCGMTMFLSISFTAYHLYLLWAGTTTNETFKWTDWKDDMKHGEMYIAKLPPSQQSSPPHFPQHNGNEDVPNALNWPLKPESMIARVTCQEDWDRLPHNLRWERADSMKDVQNIYDIGFWKNLKLVLWPTKF